MDELVELVLSSPGNRLTGTACYNRGGVITHVALECHRAPCSVRVASNSKTFTRLSSLRKAYNPFVNGIKYNEFRDAHKQAECEEGLATLLRKTQRKARKKGVPEATVADIRCAFEYPHQRGKRECGYWLCTDRNARRYPQTRFLARLRAEVWGGGLSVCCSGGKEGVLSRSSSVSRPAGGRSSSGWGGGSSTRPATRPSTRPATRPSSRPATRPATRPTTRAGHGVGHERQQQRCDLHGAHTQAQTAAQTRSRPAQQVCSHGVYGLGSGLG
jgi:hypothetical protein